uniref:Delta-aminolevulinic acid dehydratase n=1 Tax=Eutreptiella gymnastica TaxID=73025 RepID=A0A7S1NQ16_9EUGL|mmetsp:Transcript_70560/g.124353  ORF Transcript_70560/g.124353 Transcript_70560/m.124353 type:complete len:521 (+) Transcript_70560:55-1617(+)
MPSYGSVQTTTQANSRTSWNIAAACVAAGVCTVMYAAVANQSQALYASPTVVGQTSTVTSGFVAPRFNNVGRPIGASTFVPQGAQRTSGDWNEDSTVQMKATQEPSTHLMDLGLGCLIAAAMAIGYKMGLVSKGPTEQTSLDWSMAAVADGNTDVEGAAKTLPGIAARPAGYKHEVTDGYQLEEVSRPRRNRRTPAHRAFMRETHMVPANFVAPLFIHDEDSDQEISAMPGCSRLCAASVLKEVGECMAEGVNFFILFPKVADHLKTPDGRQCYDETDIVMRTIKLIKGTYPDAIVCTDVALDPYNTDGHDGIVDPETGYIINDITVEQLCKQAVQQAKAGADIVAPSDMQDGRVGAIRDALDDAGFTGVGIMTYCAKYASAFYGPFRAALDSAPGFGDKSTYQMDPANAREALREIELDEAEGADILMVKPALPYLDIIKLLKENSALPIAAYHVSGEYSMIKAGAAAGYIDEEKVALESLLSIRRAGADLILTYYAKQASKWMNDPNGYWQSKIKGKL